MMKKLFAGIVIIIGLMAVVGLTSIMVTDYRQVYQQFVQASKIDSASIEERNFIIKKFPVPYLVMDEVKQEGKVKLKNVEIHLSLMSLLTFNPKIANVKIGEAIIYLNHEDVNFLSHDEFISELITKDVLSVQAKIDKLTFIESDDDVPLVIEEFFLTSGNDLTKFSGKVDSLGQLNGSFKKAGDDVLFNLEIKDQTYSLNIEESYKDTLLESGKAEIKISNLVTKIAKFIPELNVLTDKLNSTEEVTINFDLNSTKDQMNLKNIKVSSDSLEGIGEMNLSKSSKDLNEVKLEFSKIDFVSWNKLQNSEDNLRRVKYGNNNFDLGKKPMKLNISVKDIKLNENNAINNVNIAANIEGGQLYIQDFSGDIDQTGKFKLNGLIAQNSFRRLFQGQIVLNHKDLNDFAELFFGHGVRTGNPIPFALSSGLKLSSVDILLSNFLLKTPDTEVTGNLSTKFIGSSPRTNASIKFTSIDMDKRSFPVINQVFDYALTLLDGMKEPEYLNKFIPIRQISTISNFDIVFDRLIVLKKLYENVSFNLETSPGKVSLTQLFIKDGNDWIDTSLQLEAQRVKPILNATIHSGSIGVEFLSAPRLLNLRNKILDKFDLSKIDINMDFSLKKLYHDQFSMGSVLFQAKNDKNLFEISKFNTNILGGNLQSSGSILLEPYTINFVYALNSATIAEIAKLLPNGILSGGGAFSASGMFSTNGAELKEQLYNLYTQSSFLAKDVTISNFSIDDLIQTMSVANYNVQTLQADIKKALLTGKTEISDLKTDIELTKGIFKLPSIVFKTKYSSAVGSAAFNLYDFSLNSSTSFSFYLAKPTHGRGFTDYAATKMGIIATGNLFSLKKTADTKELEAALKDRNNK